MSTETETTMIPTGTWDVDRIHSRVGFEVDHLGVSSFRGGFGDYDARLAADPNGAPVVEGTARVESIDTEGDLKAHLLSPEFFDAERHPEIGFRSTAIELGGEGELRVRGELTIRETTKEIEAVGRIGGPGVGPSGAAVVSVTLEATVDRHDFGLGWNMELPNGKQALGDQVRLQVALELVEAGE